MFKVYILKSLNYDKSYVGSTDNLERRLEEHNSGKSLYTKIYKPWKIIYQESFETLKEARLKEKYFKTKKGRQWMRDNLFR